MTTRKPLQFPAHNKPTSRTKTSSQSPDPGSGSESPSGSRSQSPSASGSVTGSPTLGQTNQTNQSSQPGQATIPPPTGRTWLLTSGGSPLGLHLARALLRHGDNVVLGCLALADEDYDDETMDDEDDEDDGWESQDLVTFVKYLKRSGYGDRVVVVACDSSQINQCQSAIATAVSRFGRLDILLCNHSEAVFGTIEELSSSTDSQMLIRQQMKTNFFGPVNMIRAAVPVMRNAGGGHIVVVTGITSHLGTPGLSMFCAAAWGLEGFCDSLAYEIAPFNIRMSIIQPSAEIAILPNRILAAPQLPQYTNPKHSAPLARSIFARMLDRLEVTAPPGSDPNKPSLLTDQRTIVDPHLSPDFLDPLLAETVHAICAIGGHENPPARHIVGVEGMVAVKEKLKTMTEELEDFVAVSTAADTDDFLVAGKPSDTVRSINIDGG